MSDFDPETGEIIEPQSAQRSAVMPAQRQQQLLPLASPACAQVCAALAAAQGMFEAVKKTKEGQVRGTTASGKEYSYSYKYAPLDEILNSIKPALAEHKLGRQQYLVTRDSMWLLRTIIWHASGEWIACDYPVFPEKKGGQGFAAAVTYARRQGYCLALGLAPEDDDDNAPTDTQTTRAPARATSTKPPPAPPKKNGAAPENPDDVWLRDFRAKLENEKGGNPWLALLAQGLSAAPSVAMVEVIAEFENVKAALSSAPAHIAQQIQDMLTDAVERFAKQEPDFMSPDEAGQMAVSA